MNAIFTMTVLVVLTANVLSNADKKKIRTIASAGLVLPCTISRTDFEALYKKALETAKLNVKISVRKCTTKAKPETLFSIIEEPIKEPVSPPIPSMSEEKKPVEPPVKISTRDKLSKIAKQMGSMTSPIVIPDPVHPVNSVPVASNSVKPAPVIVDKDKEFVSFVYDKALEGKYPKWTQNISVENLKAFAEHAGIVVDDLINKYLIAHRKGKSLACYSLKAEYIVRYYSKATFSSKDHEWFIVIKGDVAELYRGNGKQNIFVKAVDKNEDPAAYEKAVAVVNEYTFRGGEWTKEPSAQTCNSNESG